MNKYFNATSKTGMMNVRLSIIYFATLSVSLGTAVSAMGRLALYLLALWTVLANVVAHQPSIDWPDRPWFECWHVVTLMAVAFMAMSVLWTDADGIKGVSSWTRHARLITIPLLWMLIRNRSEVRSVLRVFVIAQLFVMLSSWLLVAEVPVPWATAFNAKTTFAVFGSYLEQSIMGAILVFILWYQRDWIFGKNGQWLAIAAAFVTFILVVGYLAGRTGYLVFTVLASMSIMYALPRRWRWTAVVIPFVIAAIVFACFKTARERMVQVPLEILAYSQHGNTNSSSGERLIYWQTSLQSMAEKPIAGSGSGSWNNEFRRWSAGKSVSNFETTDNPHHMFLLWAVEGGVIGLSLLCCVLLSLLMYSRSLIAPDAHSLQSVLAALVIAGLTTSTIYGIGMGDYFCMLIGIVLCNGHDAVIRHPQKSTG